MKTQKTQNEKIAIMFNVINGLSEDSKFGFKHIQKFPEDKEEIIKNYKQFIKNLKIGNI